MSISRRITEVPRALIARAHARLAHARLELKTRAGRGRLFVAWLGPIAIVALTAYAVSPVFTHLDRYGIHDWDTHAAYRHITTLSLLRFGEAPL